MALKKILEIGHHFGKVIVKTVTPIFGNGANRPTRHKHSIQTNDEVCDLSTILQTQHHPGDTCLCHILNRLQLLRCYNIKI